LSCGSSTTGKLIFHVFGALAEFERDLIRERTVAGLAAARARGRKGGRRPVLDENKLALLRSLAKDRDNSPAVICATLGISRATFYRYLGVRSSAATPTAAPAELSHVRRSAQRQPRRAATKRKPRGWRGGTR